MPYVTSLPGLAEASLDAIKGLLVAGLPDLNTQLQRRSAPLSAVVATADQFYLGDFDTLPDPKTNPFWMTIIGGGRADGRDCTIGINSSGPGYKHAVFHNIFCYIHPDSLPVTTGPVGGRVAVQAEARERLRTILQDWMVNGVFNNVTNDVITLASKQFRGPNLDTLDESMAVAVNKGLSGKSFGQSQLVNMLHVVHQGMIYGGY